MSPPSACQPSRRPAASPGLHARRGIPVSAVAGKATGPAAVTGLSEVMSRPAGSCSGGQRRPLEIAWALVSPPSPAWAPARGDDRPQARPRRRLPAAGRLPARRLTRGTTPKGEPR